MLLNSNNNEDDNDTITGSDLDVGSKLTNDYAELLKSRTVMNRVIADLNLQNTYPEMANVTPDAISGMVSIETSTNTRVLKIRVRDTNPTRAQDIANAVRRAGAEHIKNVMDIDAVNVVYEANLPDRPSSPNAKKNAMIGAMLGFIIAAAVLVINMLMDDTIKTQDDVEKYLGMSVLGMIPYDELEDSTIVRKKKKKKDSQSSSQTSTQSSSQTSIKTNSQTENSERK
jgi:Capsular polysaccharide biosynthesis protein